MTQTPSEIRARRAGWAPSRDWHVGFKNSRTVARALREGEVYNTDRDTYMSQPLRHASSWAAACKMDKLVRGSKSYEKHMQAIVSGTVTKTNVIGLRKILNADARRQQGWSTGMTAPSCSHIEAAALVAALAKHCPRVEGELHDSGLKLLRSPRYRKRLEEPVRDIIASLDTFRLVGFEPIGPHDLHMVPVYRAYAGKRSFMFHNIPWQSGGNGPEIWGLVL